VLLAVVMLLVSCQQDSGITEKPDSNTQVDLDTNVGDIAGIYTFGNIEVKGYGIVAGLAGTGSSECPPALRYALVKYIHQQMSDKVKMDASKFINSPETAVVEVYGVIPLLALKNDRFDLTVRALSSTQTTSLAGGRLFTAQLKEVARLSGAGYDQYSKTLAMAHGPVFINKLEPNSRNRGFVLGGGWVSEDIQISLGLFEAGYIRTAAVRNRLNERFGPDTATAISPAEIRLTIPARYRLRRIEFLDMVKSLYLGDSEQLQQRRIELLVGKLAKGRESAACETALKAIGKSVLDSLSPLLNDGNEKVRFHAARCMLDIGDSRAFEVLRKIIADRNSALRIEAIKAVGNNAKRNDAIAILNNIAGRDSFETRFAAYEQLRKLQDISISQKLIAGDFFVDSVIGSGERVIYVSRSEHPRVVLFGSPIRCEKDIFLESPDGTIIINVRPGDKFVSLVRKHPRRPKIIGPLNSGFELTEIIRTLCETPSEQGKLGLRPGLGISYSDLIVLLEQMCQSGSIRAQFQAGPMSTASTINMKKSRPNDR